MLPVSLVRWLHVWRSCFVLPYQDPPGSGTAPPLQVCNGAVSGVPYYFAHPPVLLPVLYLNDCIPVM